MTNFVVPELLAVKRSPVPVLSTTNPAKEVAPDMDAIGCVPFVARTSREASGEIAAFVPSKTCPANCIDVVAQDERQTKVLLP
jgi:hypothetical protein